MTKAKSSILKKCKIIKDMSCLMNMGCNTCDVQQIYEQGKKDAEEAYKTRYSVLNLCHKTIATDRVSQDNLIRKQTYEEVLKKIEEEMKGRPSLQKVVFLNTKIWLEQKIKELSK